MMKKTAAALAATALVIGAGAGAADAQVRTVKDGRNTQITGKQDLRKLRVDNDERFAATLKLRKLKNPDQGLYTWVVIERTVSSDPEDRTINVIGLNGNRSRGQVFIMDASEDVETVRPMSITPRVNAKKHRIRLVAAYVDDLGLDPGTYRVHAFTSDQSSKDNPLDGKVYDRTKPVTVHYK